MHWSSIWVERANQRSGMFRLPRQSWIYPPIEGWYARNAESQWSPELPVAARRLGRNSGVALHFRRVGEPGPSPTKALASAGISVNVSRSRISLARFRWYGPALLFFGVALRQTGGRYQPAT